MFLYYNGLYISTVTHHCLILLIIYLCTVVISKKKGQQCTGCSHSLFVFTSHTHTKLYPEVCVFVYCVCVFMRVGLRVSVFEGHFAKSTN